VGIGTALNVLAVLAGGSIGTLAGGRLPEGMRSTAMQAIGIVTLLVGVSYFLRADNVLVPLLSLILGLVVGELLDTDVRLRRLGDHLEERFSKGESRLSRAFVTTSLLITGPMISSTTATGGVLIFGLGLGLLDLKEVRVANMLPALLFAPLLVAASPLWPL